MVVAHVSLPSVFCDARFSPGGHYLHGLEVATVEHIAAASQGCLLNGVAALALYSGNLRGLEKFPPHSLRGLEEFPPISLKVYGTVTDDGDSRSFLPFF